MNPFSQKPQTQTQTSSPGANPFAGIKPKNYPDELPGECQVRAKVKGFRVVEKTAGRKMSAWADIEILEVFRTESAIVKPGAVLSHGFKGFGTAGEASAFGQLIAFMRTCLLNLTTEAALAEQAGSDPDAFWYSVPWEAHLGNISIEGAEIFIETTTKLTRQSKDPKGDPYTFIVGRYVVVDSQ